MFEPELVDLSKQDMCSFLTQVQVQVQGVYISCPSTVVPRASKLTRKRSGTVGDGTLRARAKTTILEEELMRTKQAVHGWTRGKRSGAAMIGRTGVQLPVRRSVQVEDHKSRPPFSPFSK